MSFGSYFSSFLISSRSCIFIFCIGWFFLISIVLAETLHITLIVSSLTSFLVSIVQVVFIYWVLCPLLVILWINFSSCSIFFLNIFTINNWIFELKLKRDICAYKDNTTRNGQKYNNHEVDDKLLLESLMWSEMSVLPNDIGWFRGLLKFKFGSKNFFNWRVSSDASSVVTLFRFKCSKYRDWSLKDIEKWFFTFLWFCFDFIKNSLV